MTASLVTAKRIALYARVSTARQAESDLSIPDQIRQAEAWCEQHRAVLVAQYIEPGASGTDEGRPVFQEMLAVARRKPRRFEAVLVHSFSRFCRDEFTYAAALRDLRRAGVGLHSITQPLNDDPTGKMVGSIIVAFDAYQSRENGKHTARSMKENARQGFWNGSKPPFGYEPVEAERRGDKVKKKLAVYEPEAAIVRRVFAMYLGLEGVQRGTKSIASTLNGEGVRFRGKPFSVSVVHRLLTRETYIGRHHFNVLDAKSRETRPRSEWVEISVPPIVDAHLFERTRLALADRNPKRTPPRVVAAATLLTGIARCASCGAGMTLRTGKNGRYRYYACAGRALQGPSKCAGCAVPMALLDNLVLDGLAEQIFAPNRLAELLQGYLDQAADSDLLSRQRVGRLKAELTETEGAIERLLSAIERGLVDLDDPGLAQRLTTHKATRRRLSEEIAVGHDAIPTKRRLTPANIARLSTTIKQAFKTGSVEQRRQYLRLFVSNIAVGAKTVRLSGPKSSLARAATDDPEHPGSPVLSFIPDWRPVGDSNPCYRRTRVVKRVR